jgi:choline dehydrogenase-like flavoprotein
MTMARPTEVCRVRPLMRYYDRAEDKLGVTRTNGVPPLPANNNFKVMGNGATRAGYRDATTGRMAINSVPRDGRPATVQDGERVQKARAVCVAGNAIETARLLLLSESPQHPDGLANSSGQVGRNYMRHLTGSVYAEFDQPVRMYRGETMAGIITDEARNDPDRGFVGGYYMQLLSLGLPFYAAFLDPGGWGPDFGRAHDVANLFVSDGSVFTTGAAANPTLTIVALAIRRAEHIVGEMKAGAL